MPIPPVNKIIDLDFSNPSCFNGTGLSINDLSSSNNDFTISNSSYVYSTIFGGELYLNSPNLNTFMYRDGITNYSYGTSAFSVHLWFQLNQTNALDLTQFLTVNFTGGSGSNDNPFVGCLSGNALFATDGTVYNNYSQTINLNEWYLLSFVKPSGGSMNDVQMYINGTLLSFTGGGSTPINVANPSSRMGISTAASSTPVWNAAITVGRYVFYNTAITGTDVTDFYNSTRYRFYKQLEYDFQNGSYPGSGTSVFDLSGNGITANILSGGTYVSGNVNYIDLQGNTNIFAANANIPTNTDITINAWVQPELLYPSSGYGNWWSTGNDGSGTIPFLGLSNVGGTNVIVSGGFGFGTTQTFNAANFDPTKWYYYSAVSSSATGTSLYVNGTLVGTDNDWIRPQTANFRIGTYDDVTTSTRGYGKVAYVDFYNVALTGTEILANYNASSVYYDNLIAKYDLNDPLSYSGTGSTLYDLSENGYNLTLNFGPAYNSYTGYNTLSFLQPSGQTGIRNGSIGINQTNPQFTFFTWIRPTFIGPDAYSFFVQYGEQSGALGGCPGMLIKWNGSNSFAATFGSGRADINTGTPLTLNDWVCLCSTCDGTTYKIYRDGVLVGSTALSGAQIVGPEILRLNGLVGTNLLECSFDFNYMEIYDKALTAGEISTIYNNTVSRFSVAPPAYQGSVGGRQFAQGFNG